jgi:hypothetical protein
MSPVEPNDLITAVAAQERRVLELREDLDRAESELARLKKQWTAQEAYKKRVDKPRAEPIRPAMMHADPQDLEDSATRLSMEMDRRKALLMGQQSQQGTSNPNRRRVLRGGHTRALSLLSPAKTTEDFSVHEDNSDGVKSPKVENSSQINRVAPITPTQLSKRASWAPRSVNQGSSSAMKQMAEDFKAGLWTFVEDLRQATVGDEPIHGTRSHHLRGIDGDTRSRIDNVSHSGDQDTIRASSTTTRPRVTSAFDKTPTPQSRLADAQKQEKETGTPARHTRTVSKTKSRAEVKSKHFLWTPLTVDSLDDNDWSGWESPTVKSQRWSGTTANEDITPTMSDKGDVNKTSS